MQDAGNFHELVRVYSCHHVPIYHIHNGVRMAEAAYASNAIVTKVGEI